MPFCTGNPEQKGMWVCPYGKLSQIAISCHTLQDVDPYDPSKGQVKVSCKEPCTRACFHSADPGEFWEHVKEAHSWDCRNLDEEPYRHYDDWEAPLEQPKKRQLPVQRGPSKAARAKARAKRKKKKKRK